VWHRTPLRWLLSLQSKETRCWPPASAACSSISVGISGRECRHGKTLLLPRLLATEVMAACLSWHLDRKKTWQLGKKLAQKQGVESQGARDVRVTLATGRQIIVRTPYLLPRRSKRRDYRRLPGSRRSGVEGSYPLLKRLGFVNRRSLLYCQEVAQAATLCPSLEVTKRLLASRGGSRVTRSAPPVLR
jgi:hypothetical protein